MTIWAALETADADGVHKIAGFYHSPEFDEDTVPDSSVIITEEQFEALLMHQQTHRWQNGDVVVYSDPDAVPSAIARALVDLNNELNSYIAAYYDQGTQSSFQAIYISPQATDSLKLQIESVWVWIQSVVSYYYTCKEGVSSCLTEAEVTAYTWDFTQFDSSKPDVNLQGIYASLNS